METYCLNYRNKHYRPNDCGVSVWWLNLHAIFCPLLQGCHFSATIMESPLSENHFPVLNAAVYNGYQEVALDLVRHHADIEAVSNEGATSLHIAACQ